MKRILLLAAVIFAAACESAPSCPITDRTVRGDTIVTTYRCTEVIRPVAQRDGTTASDGNTATDAATFMLLFGSGQ